jgi:hypothetical protein
MLAAVKGWQAVLAAVIAAILLPISGASAADDLNAAATTLARKTAAFAGRGETVAIAYKNVSSLAPAEWTGVRTAFESTLRDAGARPADSSAGVGAVEVRLTVSETPSQYLLVAEARRGDDKQVWFASWNRTAGEPVKPSGVSLDLKPVWRQTEQILDIGFPPGSMLVLSTAKLTLYTRTGDSWTPQTSLPIANAKPWPRDMRGRLRTTGATFQAFLPGMVCNGNTAPALSVDCRASEAPWVLESGSRGLLLATFAASRDYFDGRVVTQSGARKTVAPFYTAASVESQGRTLWVMAQTDGRTQIADSSLEPVATIGPWGSDIAGIDAPCGGASQVLATRAGDSSEPDALQSFTIADRAATPVTAAAMLPGPVTALWPGGTSAALAVVRDLGSGDFIAYVASVSCR